MNQPSRASGRLSLLVLATAIATTVMSGCATLPWAKANSGPSGPATVAGKVTSDRGAVIANASVVLHGSSVRRTTTTDIGGRFVFERIPLGRFTVSVSSPGYKGAKQAVQVEQEGPVQLDVRLRM